MPVFIILFFFLLFYASFCVHDIFWWLSSEIFWFAVTKVAKVHDKFNFSTAIHSRSRAGSSSKLTTDRLYSRRQIIHWFVISFIHTFVFKMFTFSLFLLILAYICLGSKIWVRCRRFFVEWLMRRAECWGTKMACLPSSCIGFVKSPFLSCYVLTLHPLFLRKNNATRTKPYRLCRFEKSLFLPY